MGGQKLTKVISLFNQAGGVGKSTTTQNLGYHLCVRRHRVLLVDIDPQVSLTTFMGLEPSEIEPTIYDALVSDEDEPLPIHQNLHGVDLDQGSFVGASEISDDSELFEEKMQQLKALLENQFKESARAQRLVRDSLWGLGYGE